MRRLGVKLVDSLFAGGIIRGTAFNMHFNDDVRDEPCVYCGKPSNSWEHVVPKSKGGKKEVFNRVRACAKCNSDRGNKPFLIYMLEKKHE